MKKLIQTADGYEYRGYQIRKTWKHGYVYWRINKEKETCSTRSDAMRAIDSRIELFEKALAENKIYCELVEMNSNKQIEQLKVCNDLMGKVANKGLLIEYSEFVERAAR